MDDMTIQPRSSASSSLSTYFHPSHCMRISTLFEKKDEGLDSPLSQKVFHVGAYLVVSQGVLISSLVVIVCIIAATPIGTAFGKESTARQWMPGNGRTEFKKRINRGSTPAQQKKNGSEKRRRMSFHSFVNKR